MTTQPIPAPWRHSDTFAWMEHAQSGFGPAVITCAVNGGVQGRESHPRLPETPADIAEEVHAAYEAGASVVHIHPRDSNDLASTSRTADDFAEVNQHVRKHCPDIVINNTTGGAIGRDETTYFGILEARPEMASFNLGPDIGTMTFKERGPELPHPRAAFSEDYLMPWTYRAMEELAGLMKDADVVPELELYHSGQFWVSRRLAAKGLLPATPVFQFVMGYQTSAFPTPENVIRLTHELPEPAVFFCAGIGAFQVPMTTTALLMGGHARVGLEDNLYYARGRKLVDNAEAVTRTAGIIELLGRTVATPAEARQILGVSATPREFS